MFELKGKVALVTGGSRGIGRAIAEVLAAQGAYVVINYLKADALAQQTVAAIVARGGSAECVGFDVSHGPSVDEAVAAMVKQHGRVDMLVANAGIAIDGLLLRLKEEDLDRMWNTNVKGAILCARAVMKPMLRQRSGRVVFLSSVVGEMGNAGQTAYAASKAALLGVTKTLAREYASRRITVNAVAPGFIETDMTSGISAEAKEALHKAIPLGRIGSASEVAAAVAFLCSDEASYVTGQTLRVNGGMHV